MTDIQRLEKGLIAADQAGDTESATIFAQELRRLRQQPQDTGRGIFGAIGEAVGSAAEDVGELITGSERTTKEIEGMRDWWNIPELRTPLKGQKLPIGIIQTLTALAPPEEATKILQENIPDLEVRKDEKGNFIYKSPSSGEEFAYKPGIQTEDIEKTLVGSLPYLVGGASSILGRLGLAALQETGIQAAQSFAGGEFDPEDIALAGVTDLGGEAVGRAITALKPSSKLAGKVVPDVQEIPLEELAKSAVAGGDSQFFGQGARQVVEQQVMPDKEIIDAAEKIGVLDYLRADHVSTNQEFKELSAGIASFPMSQAKQIENNAIDELGKRARKSIEDLGGVTDISQLNYNVKENLSSIQEGLEAQSKKLYDDLTKKIPAKTPAQADSVLSFINNKVNDGVKLTPVEKEILNTFTPKTIPKTNLSSQDITRQALGLKVDKEQSFATYARLDQVRRQLTAARVKKQGKFMNEDAGLLKALETRLLSDQKKVIENLDPNLLQDFNLARKTVLERKQIEDQMVQLFGKNLDKSIVNPLISGVDKLSKGDISNFSKFIKSIPENQRKEVATSGLMSALSKNNKDGAMNVNAYVKWYDGLQNNKQAKNLLYSNISKDARDTLDNFYKVAQGINSSRKEFIGTGRIRTIEDALNNTETLTSNIMRTARNLPKIAITEGVATAFGYPGAGFVSSIMSSMQGGKTAAIKAADNLISNPKFIRNSMLGTEKAIEEIANMSAFKQFLKEAGLKQSRSDSIKFITSMMQASKQGQEEKQQ